uniref:Uncharacterized protein n=1 Tax=Aegilops tauschii subsp. strangulata TaxID=200361 RepID=A0A453B1Q9_AEGTS
RDHLLMFVSQSAGRFIPGCYTLAVSEELPEEYQGMCQDNNVQYFPPKRP